MIKKRKNLQSFYLIIFFTFFIHLFSINFHPTNFEGGYGAFANIFDQTDKLRFIESYHIAQFNTYIFSATASVIKEFFPFLNGFQSVKLLSALSYFFLGFGILNIFKFFNIKNNQYSIFLLIFFNSVIWSYGHRSFNDLFSFSIGIYFFSNILILESKKSLYINIFFLGIASIFKSFNLIFLIPILFNYFFKNNKKNLINFNFFKIILIFLLPYIVYHLIIFKSLGFLFAPKNEDLQIAIIGNDSSRNLLWVLNNFIFYLGYLTLITLPFSAIFYFKLNKIVSIKTIFTILFLILFSIYFQKFLFISSELDLGPIQKYIPDSIYKTTILICFFFFNFIIYTFLQNKKLFQGVFLKYLILILTIVIYLIVLSFIKAAQRYLILPLPFFVLFIFYVIHPRIIVISMLVIYTFFNSLLLLNYYVTGKSTELIMEYLKRENILENTIPGVITPHVYHLYNNCVNFKPKSECSNFSNKAITISSPKYIVVNYTYNAIYSSDIEIFGINFKKYSVINN